MLSKTDRRFNMLILALLYICWKIYRKVTKYVYQEDCKHQNFYSLISDMRACFWKYEKSNNKA